jgi:lantibiotic modifying enzyme
LFDQCEFRQILRPTKTYAAIASVLSKLENDRRDYATAWLSKAYRRDVDQNRLEKARLVLKQEVDAVMKAEIPLFYTYGNGTDLYCNGEKVLENHLLLSPVDYARKRLEALSNKDLARQLKIIELAIDASAPLEKYQIPFRIHTDAVCPGETAAEMVTNCAVDGLGSVFCGLQGDKNGSVDFISCGYSLYQGLCGVLCMYAALLRKTGKTVYADHLYRYYEHVRDVFFHSNDNIVLSDNNCSLADGILGVISCLEHIGSLIEDSTFINDAKVLARRLVLSEHLVNTDYLNGAGSLPLVFKRVGVELPVSLISLFKSATPFTTGVAHGSSGIALSLCAWNTPGFTEETDKKILSVLHWENEQYSTKDNNWFDLRDKTKKGFMSGWCSGAPGIGMARQYIRTNTTNTQLKRLCEADLENVRRFLSERTACKRDTLCCGTSSVLMAASVLDVPVDALYAQLCAAEKSNKLRVSHIISTNDNNVSLMQGLSGIAYALAMYGDSLSGGMLI